jgi:phenylalanyl-tRNA synthetase alpha chain
MIDKIEKLEKEIKEAIAQVATSKAAEELRIKYFSKKGEFTRLFDEFRTLPREEKPKVGQFLNKVKNELNELFKAKQSEIKSAAESSKNYIDLTLPGKKRELGSYHLLTQTLREIKSIFRTLGFSIHEGPELESDYYNFEALNFPPDHPARDMQDTFFINDKFLLRTHTSPVQARLMQSTDLPIRAIIPGKVYRNEAISAKSYCLFHQVEGLYIDENVTFAELVGTLVSFAREFFGADVKYRFRPSFFPFTEPSAEVDIWWEPAGKEGRWLEILGCGMVDPNVLEFNGIDSEKYTGYAFGLGIERMTMLKYGIDDIRIFFDNDKRFLEQF